MEVKSIIFGEDIIELKNEFSDGEGQVYEPKMAVVNPTFSFIPQFIPSSFSFSALVMMVGKPSGNTLVRIEFKNTTTDETLYVAKNVISDDFITKPNSKKEFTGLNMSIPLKNVTLETEGDYSLKVYLNDKLKGESTLRIIKNETKKE